MVVNLGRNVPKTVAMLERRRAVRTDLLNGVVNRADLAARHGVSVPTISIDIKEILYAMRRQYEEEGRFESEFIQEKLNHVYQKATKAFERSQQEAEKIRTEYVKRRCPDCNGTGMEGGDEDSEEWCERCEGGGIVVDEVVTREVRGQSGDANFLRVQIDCLKELSKLKGVYPITKREEKGIVNMNVIQIPGVDLSQVPSEKLLEAMKVLQVASKSDQDVIDVEKR